MKNIIFVLTLLLTTHFVNAQTDCRPYVPVNEGAKWEITNYNAKGKEMGKTSFELIEKVETGDEITFTIKSIAYDKKGSEILDNSYDAKCINGKFSINMAFKMDATSLEAYKNMDMTMDASEFEIPSMDAAEGTTLPDGSLKVSIDTGSPITMGMNVMVTDRKIEAKEKLTTSAGSFDCMVLTQNVSTKMMVQIKASSKEWYAENVGMVRSESYNKKGKMTGYSVLTKFEEN